MKSAAHMIESHMTDEQLSELAARFHEDLDAISDRADAIIRSGVSMGIALHLRSRENALRIQIRLLRTSRSGAFDDLEAGIAISLDELAREVEKLEES